MTEANNKFNRRRLIGLFAGGSAMLGRSADGQAPAAVAPKSGAVITVTAIHQEEEFSAAPQRLYEALLDSKQFTAFAGGRKANISREVGGTFSVFDGHIIGRNLELVRNQRIVQAWRVVPRPAGVYSIARFELQAKGNGTRLTFDHTGFPSDLGEHLASGWTENYWQALRKHLSA